MAVSLAPEKLFEVGGFDVTNSMLAGVLLFVLLGLFFVIYTSKIKLKPNSRLQLIVESVVLSLRDLAEGIMGEKATKAFFPIVFTFFIFIITSNWFGLMPFVGSIGYTHHAKEGEKTVPIFVIGSGEEHSEKSEATTLETETTSISEKGTDQHEETTYSEPEKESHSNFEVTNKEVIHKPFFRSPSADLNFTIALAIISFCLIQFAALKAIKVEHLLKFFDYRVSIPKGWKVILLPFTFVLNFFWRTLELILEVAKIISFSFRLFGNIFAGEVLLFVITTLTFGIATLPFLGLELFVGFIQALVFSLLTMVFIKVSSESHHAEHFEPNAA